MFSLYDTPAGWIGQDNAQERHRFARSKRWPMRPSVGMQGQSEQESRLSMRLPPVGRGRLIKGVGINNGRTRERERGGVKGPMRRV